MNAVPAERVAQIHIAGHSNFEKYILDTHDHPVIDPVWELYARAIQRCGPTATLLEWDDSIPSFDEVHSEALKANRYLMSIESALPERGGDGCAECVPASASSVRAAQFLDLLEEAR